MISFLNRWIHVAAMAVIFGGSILMWAAARRYRSGSEDLPGSDALLLLSRQYEWLFWGGLGLLALTGIGNLGNFGANLPDPISAWGGRLLAKLTLVLLLALFSAIRTWVVAGLGAGAEDPPSSKTASLLQNFYGGTSLFIVVILVLAVSLSHA
jgi:uncharacterized membrane protein